MVDLGAGEPSEGEAPADTALVALDAETERAIARHANSILSTQAADAESEPQAAEEEDDMAKPKSKTRTKPVVWEHVQTSESGDYYWAEVADADGMPVIELFITRGEELSKPAWTWSVRFIGDNSRIWGADFFGRATDAQAAVVAELPEIMTDPRICG